MSWYTSLARPLLFSLDPERAHDLTMRALRMPGVPALLRASHYPPPPTRHPTGAAHHPALRQQLLGLTFDNPLGLAAGLDKQGTAVKAWSALGFGHAEIGTVTPLPQPGNPKPRLFRLPEDRALINRFGFNSEGAAAVAAHLAAIRAPGDRPDGMRLGVNVGRNKETANDRAVDDYVRAIEVLRTAADYFVVNVSSPNTAGLRALQRDQTLRPLLEQCVRAARRDAPGSVPVMVKVSPDLTPAELVRSVDAALEGGAAGVIATNTTTARAGLRAPASLSGEAGGLSGAPLRRPANDACRTLFRHLRGRVPIVGVGGIGSADDAYERIRAGASLVQIYTAFVYEGPALAAAIVDGLAERLSRDGCNSMGDAIGADIT